MRASGVIVFAILAGLLAWLAIANRTMVTLSFDAMRPGSPASSIELPLFAVLLIGALAGLIVGGTYMQVRRRALAKALKAETARADRLQRLLGDETLGKTGAASPVSRQLSRISN